VSRHIVFDSAPLGIISKPARSAEVIAIINWATDCLAAGHGLYIPEVIDYEVRRELLRAGKAAGIVELDKLKDQFRYVPITTDAILVAADLWAQSRRSGFATGDPKRLDIDVILAAQAITLDAPTSDTIVATTNVGHLARFIAADLWANIKP
jgi:predicted nucleic acid-binding protein